MCCETMGHHRGHSHAMLCGCQAPHCSDSRHCWTEEDKLAYYEQHLKDLRAEVKAAEARLKELRSEK